MSITQLIAICGTIIGSFVGMATFFNVVQKKTLDNGRMLEKVDTIQATVSGIDRKVEKKNELMDSILKSQNEMLIRHDSKICEHEKEIESIKTRLQS